MSQSQSAAGFPQGHGSASSTASAGVGAGRGDKKDHPQLAPYLQSLRQVLFDLERWKSADLKPEELAGLAEGLEVHVRSYIDHADQLAYCYERDQEHAVHSILLDDQQAPSQGSPSPALFDESVYTPFLHSQLSEFRHFEASLNDFRDFLRIHIVPPDAPISRLKPSPLASPLASSSALVDDAPIS